LPILQAPHSAFWDLAQRQHGVVTRHQLLELGYSAKAIDHRVGRGRLHVLWRGVYAVGRPEVISQGRWLAAVLSCGPASVLSHDSAAALWMIRPSSSKAIHVTVPYLVARRPPAIVVHRRRTLADVDVTRHCAIPVTTPICTLIDLAGRLEGRQLEAAVNEADKRDLIRTDELRSALDEVAPRPGVRALREMLERPGFTLTDSELERSFVPIAHRAGLPAPLTGHHVNGFKVDFFWPELGLVVETDGLRYHRTAAQQVRDRLRDQAHTAAGLTPLRFTRAQVRFEPRHVEATLAAVAERLRASG
jgi:hypothetical protein